jgi:hypothetical protein
MILDGHIPYICTIDHQPENKNDSQIQSFIYNHNDFCVSILGGKTNNNLLFHCHNIEQCWGGVVDREF